MSNYIRILNNSIGILKKHLGDNGFWKWVTDAIPAGRVIDRQDERIPTDELIDILNWRFDPKRRAAITTVFGDPDFLPFSFLEKGVRCGAAVCRLVRRYGWIPQYDAYGVPQLEDLIQEIRRIEQARGELFSEEEISRIFSISQHEKEDLFANQKEHPVNAIRREKLDQLKSFNPNKKYLLTDQNCYQDSGLEALIDTFRSQDASRHSNSLNRITVDELADILLIGEESKKRIFGEDNADPIEALNSQILKKLMPLPVGTGFLVGRNYLLTNHHVLSKVSIAHEFIAEFGFEQDILGRNIEPIRYQLDPSFFITNPYLDYTLIKVRSEVLSTDPEYLGHAGDHFGWLPLVEDWRAIAPPFGESEAKEFEVDVSESRRLSSEARKRFHKPDLLTGKPSGLSGEPVNIIQHPKGKRKEIVLSSNRIQRINQDFLRYEADADFSSSGSPVLNQQWQLVGLHYASIADEKFNIIGHEGIRVCKIVQDLKKKSSNLQRIVQHLKAAAEAASDCALLVRAYKHINDLAIAHISISGKIRIELLSGTNPRVAAIEKELIRDPRGREAKFQFHKQEFARIAEKNLKSSRNILRELRKMEVENTPEAEAETIPDLETEVIVIDNWSQESFEKLLANKKELASRWLKRNYSDVAAFLNDAKTFENAASDLQKTAEKLSDEFIRPFVVELDKSSINWI